MKRNIQITLMAIVVLLLSSACTAVFGPSAQPTGPDPPEHPMSPPAHPKFESTGLSAAWTDPKTGLNVSNDMWNCPQAACGKQEVWANSSSDWGVVSTMAKGNTAVLTYPAVQRLFGADDKPAPLANARELQSTFTESMPTTNGTIGEAAYDIWLNSWNTEIMIWVDNQHQQFTRPVVGIATLLGQKFTVYVTPGAQNGYPRGPFFFVLQKHETSGTVDILGAIRWLERDGYLSASGAGLTAVDFGWEICSTNGAPENFSISRYTITAEGIQLSAESKVSGDRPGTRQLQADCAPVPGLRPGASASLRFCG